jgi:hypothetical protein
MSWIIWVHRGAKSHRIFPNACKNAVVGQNSRYRWGNVGTERCRPAGIHRSIGSVHGSGGRRRIGCLQAKHETRISPWQRATRTWRVSLGLTCRIWLRAIIRKRRSNPGDPAPGPLHQHERRPLQVGWRTSRSAVIRASLRIGARVPGTNRSAAMRPVGNPVRFFTDDRIDHT